MKITILPSVKCSLCNSLRVVNVIKSIRYRNKPCGRFCEECRMYQEFSPLEYTKVMNVKKGENDFYMKTDFVFFVRKIKK